MDRPPTEGACVTCGNLATWIKGRFARPGGSRLAAAGLLTVLILPCVAARPAGARSPPQAPRFVTLSEDEGLGNSVVEAIAEDRLGFMWFGTADGLTRYDGHDAVVYRHDPEDPGSLSSSYVEALLTDRDGVLWVGTHSGLNSYDPRTDAFVRHLADDDDPTTLIHSQVNTLFEDRLGELWAGTGNGLSRYNREDGTFAGFPPDRYAPQRPQCASEIRAILGAGDGSLWLGLANCGLVRFEPETGASTHYLQKADGGGLSGNDVWDLARDRSGGLWIATMAGLNFLDEATGVFRHFRYDVDDPRSIPSDYVDTLWLDGEDRLWIGTDGGGLAVFDREEETFTAFGPDPTDETTLPSAVIRTIFEDRRKDLWIGTYKGGVAFHTSLTMQFSYFHRSSDRPGSLSHSSVLSFFEEDDGTLWVGTEGGLNRFDPQDETFRSYQHDPRDPTSLSANAVLSILKDSRGNLWVGTYHGGLNRFEPTSETFAHYRPDPEDPRSLSNPHVWSLYEDSRGDLWAGTFGGVNRFDYDSGSFEHFAADPEDPTSLGNQTVWDIHEDDAGHLWFATLWGLSRWDPATSDFFTYRHDPEDPSSLSSNDVQTILGDSAGRIWLGTESGGISVLDPESGTFESFRGSSGLPNNQVNCILEDSDGRLWVSTNAGLSKFEPATVSFTNYARSDGMLAHPLARNTCIRTRSGEMFFGGVNGFSGFSPDRLTDNPVPPPVVLTEFRLFNERVKPAPETGPLLRQITEADRIKLRHDQSVISFTFAALNYRSPEKNQYAYRMENFDRNWIFAGDRRTATYTNLDPGHYRFRVKASNNSGVWNEEGAAVDLVIAPPVWKTLWFRALTSLGIAALLLGTYQLRTKRMRSRNQALQAEIDERLCIEAEHERLLEEMATKTTILESQNAELERFAYTVSHDLATPLVTIKGFLGLLQKDLQGGNFDQVEKSIERIDFAASNMHTLLGELLELSRVGRVVTPPELIDLGELARESAQLVAGAALAANVEIEIQDEMPTVFADRRRLLEVLQNLLENAVKFMDGQERPRIVVSASTTDGEALCRVEDNGRGIEARFHDKVFGLFERLDATEAGSGVGLALVKRIIELHDGRIWIESKGEGQGAAFCFTLPLADADRRS